MISTGVEKAQSAGVMIHGLEADTFELLMRIYSDAISKIIVEGSDREQMIRMLRDVGAVFRNGMMSIMEDK